MKPREDRVAGEFIPAGRLNRSGKMPSLRKAGLPGSCNSPEQLGMSPSRHRPLIPGARKAWPLPLLAFMSHPAYGRLDRLEQSSGQRRPKGVRYCFLDAWRQRLIPTVGPRRNIRIPGTFACPHFSACIQPDPCRMHLCAVIKAEAVRSGVHD